MRGVEGNGVNLATNLGARQGSPTGVTVDTGHPLAGKVSALRISPSALTMPRA